MTAKTGHERQSALMQRGRLTDLFTSAITLVRENKRSELQCALFEKALQLFKENRLGAVLSGSVNGMPSNMQELLSLPIEGVLQKHSLNYFRNHGIAYVGELFLDCFWQSGSLKVAQQCRDSITNLGLPFNLDLDTVGWIAPYANDPSFISALTIRFHEFSKSSLKNGCQTHGGCITIGEMMQKCTLGRWLRFGRHILPQPLRAGMYVSSSWMPPPRDSQGCAESRFTNWDGERIPIGLNRKLNHKGLETIQDLVRVGLQGLATEFNSNELNFLARIAERRKLRLINKNPGDALDLLVEEFDLSIRTRNTLTNSGIVTVSDVIGYTEGDLLRLNNFGRRNLVEIKETLARLGLTLSSSTT